MLNNFYISENIPNPLTNEELLDNFIKLSKGDMNAREKLITHNMRIVIEVVNKNFGINPYDKEELISVGLIGLIKSVDAFDINRQVPFYSYAKKCIIKEILVYMKSNKKCLNNISINQSLDIEHDGKDLTLEDTLPCDINLEEEYIEKEIISLIKEYISNLEGREKIIIMYRYGLFDGKFYKLREVANILNVSGSYVSILEHKVLNEIKKTLEVKKDKYKKFIKQNS